MDLGIQLVHDGLTYEQIRDAAQSAERAGLSSIWLIDHLNGTPTPDTTPLLECWTMLSALAPVTKKIRLGALVLNINNRNPALLAKMAATLDQISGGRLEFGIGAGGMYRAEDQKKLGFEYEFDAYGISFPTSARIRIERLDEGLEIVKTLWTRDRATFAGKHYSIKDAYCLPKPIQKPYPPIWIGGLTGPKVLSVVAKHASGWNLMRLSTIEQYREGLKLLGEACNKLGRKVEEIKTSIAISGSVEECRQKLSEFEHEGLDLAILRAPKGGETEFLRELNWK
jgi:alkanesulfonate monooxygenase SsuD/methylene tetrahydromethanopterin reductase-like flavin-dependent oxidoreductase (luciferase family)